MAAVANIVLPDAQATPVNHTFVPLGPDSKNVWWFEDQSAVTPIGYGRVSVSLTRPPMAARGTKAEDRVIRCKIGIYTPKLETMSNNSAGYVPAPVVAYQLTFKAEFAIPERATLLDRKDLRKYASAALADVQIVAALEQLQGLY